MRPPRNLGRDEDEMLRLKAGDSNAFTRLVERYRGPLVHFLYRMVGDAATAEELAQEVFVRVYGARRRYRPRAKFSTWLFRIATNLALNSLRDTRLRRQLEARSEEQAASRVAGLADPVANMEQQLLAQERRATIRRAVESLPEKQRLAVLLHKYQELDYAEIAAILGCSESALKSLLFRAYEALRAKLRPLLGVRA